ncbi:MAG: glycine zipper domain-containing protein [Candidatus Methylomirabilia bacterium]
MKGFCGAVILVFALSGCASGPGTTREKTTLGGAAIGAGTGALIGAASGGKAGVGALIGGGIGALSGALLGDQLQKVERERGAPAYPPPPPPAAPQAVGPPPPPPQVVASRPAGDPTKGEFINGTPWVVRVYINADPNNVGATTPVVLPPNQVVPWGLDIGTHRIIARAYVETQYGERVVGRFDRTIQIDPRRPGWLLKLQDSDFR